MARIRTIKPEFWTDERVVELDPWTRLLFIGLWNFADDEGRMVCSEKRIKMQIFPADSLNIRGSLDELSRVGLIELYLIEGTEYLQIPTFLKHQRVDHPKKSKLPSKPKERRTDSPSVQGALAPEGKGREGNGREETTPAVPTRTTGASGRPHAGAVPPDGEGPKPIGEGLSLDALRVAPGAGTAEGDHAAELWAALAANGCKGTASHPAVIEMARQGVTVKALKAAIAEARKSTEGQLNPAYLAAIVERMRAEKPANGKAQAWATDERACEAKARELGLWPAKPGEDWNGLRSRIRATLDQRAQGSVR